MIKRQVRSETTEFSLNVFTEFAEFSDKNICYSVVPAGFIKK